MMIQTCNGGRWNEMHFYNFENLQTGGQHIGKLFHLYSPCVRYNTNCI